MVIFLDTTTQSCERFRRNHRELLDSLLHLHFKSAATRNYPIVSKHKYQIKNTTGYSLNALVDYHDPLEILQHLMIGSEGTLGFISEITYRTIPDPAHKGTALVLFPDIVSACSVVTELKNRRSMLLNSLIAQVFRPSKTSPPLRSISKVCMKMHVLFD